MNPRDNKNNSVFNVTPFMIYLFMKFIFKKAYIKSIFFTLSYILTYLLYLTYDTESIVYVSNFPNSYFDRFTCFEVALCVCLSIIGMMCSVWLLSLKN